MLEFIDKSFLSEKMKEEYKKLLSDRMVRLN
jgi:hypothetical protein